TFRAYVCSDNLVFQQRFLGATSWIHDSLAVQSWIICEIVPFTCSRPQYGKHACPRRWTGTAGHATEQTRPRIDARQSNRRASHPPSHCLYRWSSKVCNQFIRVFWIRGCVTTS